MTKDQCINQLNNLFLTDPKSGVDMVFCSELQLLPDASGAFEVMNIETGEKQRVMFKIEEI